MWKVLFEFFIYIRSFLINGVKNTKFGRNGMKKKIFFKFFFTILN